MKTTIKRTSKQWNEIYFKYIEDQIKSADDINNDYGANIPDTLKDRLSFVLSCFNSEYNDQYNKKRYPNLTNRIADWFIGLPGVIDIDFENYKILQLCEKWGVIAPDAKEAQQDKLLEGWFVFIAHYLLKLAKKHKIDIDYLY